jgi:hypothetical protein
VDTSRRDGFTSRSVSDADPISKQASAHGESVNSVAMRLLKWYNNSCSEQGLARVGSVLPSTAKGHSCGCSVRQTSINCNWFANYSHVTKGISFYIDLNGTVLHTAHNMNTCVSEQASKLWFI